jgi:type IV secretory pathway TrbL component
MDNRERQISYIYITTSIMQAKTLLALFCTIVIVFIGVNDGAPTTTKATTVKTTATVAGKTTATIAGKTTASVPGKTTASIAGKTTVPVVAVQ